MAARVTAPPLTVPLNVAEVPAVALSDVAACSRPEDWLIAPAAVSDSAPAVAVRSPASTRSPSFVVARVMALAETGPETVRVCASVRLKPPFVTLNGPRVLIWLAPVRSTWPAADPVRVSAEMPPPFWVILPADAVSVSAPVA